MVRTNRENYIPRKGEGYKRTIDFGWKKLTISKESKIEVDLQALATPTNDYYNLASIANFANKYIFISGGQNES